MTLDTHDDRQVFLGTLFGEARGEPAAGREAVAAVVMNRVAAAGRHMRLTGRPHPLFGDGTVRRACLVPWQFSCWNHDDPNRLKILALDPAAPDLAGLLALADRAMSGALADPTGGATHYKENSLPWPPSWGAGPLTPNLVAGRQSFYKLG